MSAAAPLLAALLRAALPGLRALDLGLPAPPLLLPWLPGTLCGAADAEALPPAEADLLRRFRHPDGGLLVALTAPPTPPCSPARPLPGTTRRSG